jgi:hypothetical protein
VRTICRRKKCPSPRTVNHFFLDRSVGLVLETPLRGRRAVEERQGREIGYAERRKDPESAA